EADSMERAPVADRDAFIGCPRPCAPSLALRVFPGHGSCASCARERRSLPAGCIRTERAFTRCEECAVWFQADRSSTILLTKLGNNHDRIRYRPRRATSATRARPARALLHGSA